MSLNAPTHTCKHICRYNEHAEQGSANALYNDSISNNGKNRCVCASWAEEKVPGLVGNKNISVVTMNMQRKAQQMHCIMVPFLTMAEEEVSI